MVRKVAIPEQIRRVRRLLGDTQAQFAKRLVVDPVTVARWEIGQRTCSGLHALTIAQLDPTGTLLEVFHEGSYLMPKTYKTIAFFSHKGGVSKTTTTYNLGWALVNAGKRVLMIDGDPQCNLTGMTLSLAGQEDFEKLYQSDNHTNLYDALRPAFEATPERIRAVECFEVGGRPGLYLLPGHVSVAEYDVPLGVAHELTGSLGVMKNLPGAINALIDTSAKELHVDYVLVDMSPSISAINQNFFMTSTHFVVPCSPDYFCSLAIDSLAKVLPRWAQWPIRAKESGLFDGAAYPIPTHTPLFLGTLNQRYRPRYGAPARGFQMWIDRINERVKSKLVPALLKQQMMLPDATYQDGTVNADPYSLANIADFNTLIARSQDQNVPIFELTDTQLGVTGPLLKNMRKSRKEFHTLFKRLAESVISMTTTSSHSPFAPSQKGTPKTQPNKGKGKSHRN
jgi:chromosome partitioning protein